MKLKKGDNVKVTTGNDKGKTGEILEIIPKKNKIIVKDVNMRRKATKPKKAGEQGGIITSEHPFDSSKVMLICPKCNKPTRVGYKVDGDKKIRICKKCGAELK